MPDHNCYKKYTKMLSINCDINNIRFLNLNLQFLKSQNRQKLQPT